VALPLLEKMGVEKKARGQGRTIHCSKKVRWSRTAVNVGSWLSKVLGFSEASCFFIEEKVLEWGFSKMGGGKV